MLKHAEPWIRVSLWPMAAHNVCQARVEEELKKLDAGAKESARLESMSISYQVDDLRRCLAKHVKLFQDIWGKIGREKHDRHDQTFRFERSRPWHQYVPILFISTYLSVSQRILIKSACSAGQAMSKRGDYGHFSSWARPLLEEFLPLPAEVRDFHRDVEDLRTWEPGSHTWF